jgi:hypothetical protein
MLSNFGPSFSSTVAPALAVNTFTSAVLAAVTRANVTNNALPTTAIIARRNFMMSPLSVRDSATQGASRWRLSNKATPIANVSERGLVTGIGY